MAVAGRSDESVWIRQAQEIRKQMTDSLIDSAFTYLPEGVKHDEIELIKRKLKRRRLELEAVASQYYRLLQRTPVVAGTNQSDYFLIERQAPDRTILRIYDPETVGWNNNSPAGKPRNCGYTGLRETIRLK